MDVTKFFEYFLKVHDEIDCHNGLKLVWNGKFEELGYVNWFKVPVFEVVNPNNSPYTEECLSIILEDTIDTFRRMVPILDSSIWTSRLYMIDSLNIYIPTKKENSIQNCLSKIEIEDESFDVEGDDYLISGKFTGDYNFESDSSTIIVVVEFEITSVTLNGEYIDDEEIIDRVKDSIYESWSEWYDAKTWHCFSNLYENDNFIQKEEMGWNTGIHLIT